VSGHPRPDLGTHHIHQFRDIGSRNIAVGNPLKDMIDKL